MVDLGEQAWKHNATLDIALLVSQIEDDNVRLQNMLTQKVIRNGSEFKERDRLHTEKEQSARAIAAEVAELRAELAKQNGIISELEGRNAGHDSVITQRTVTLDGLNAQIVDYEGKITEQEIQLVDKQARIDDLTGQEAKNAQDISDLEQRIVTLSQEIESLDKLISELEEEHNSHNRSHQAFNKHRERLNKSKGSSGTKK
jgi:chromosome segregation ATPase